MTRNVPLTADDREQIYMRKKSGLETAFIAGDFGVHPATVRRVFREEASKHAVAELLAEAPPWQPRPLLAANGDGTMSVLGYDEGTAPEPHNKYFAPVMTFIAILVAALIAGLFFFGSGQ